MRTCNLNMVINNFTYQHDDDFAELLLLAKPLEPQLQNRARYLKPNRQERGNNKHTTNLATSTNPHNLDQPSTNLDQPRPTSTNLATSTKLAASDATTPANPQQETQRPSDSSKSPTRDPETSRPQQTQQITNQRPRDLATPANPANHQPETQRPRDPSNPATTDPASPANPSTTSTDVATAQFATSSLLQYPTPQETRNTQRPQKALRHPSNRPQTSLKLPKTAKRHSRTHAHTYITHNAS